MKKKYVVISFVILMFFIAWAACAWFNKKNFECVASFYVSGPVAGIEGEMLLNIKLSDGYGTASLKGVIFKDGEILGVIDRIARLKVNIEDASNIFIVSTAAWPTEYETMTDDIVRSPSAPIWPIFVDKDMGVNISIKKISNEHFLVKRNGMLSLICRAK